MGAMFALIFAARGAWQAVADVRSLTAQLFRDPTRHPPPDIMMPAHASRAHAQPERCAWEAQSRAGHTDPDPLA
eukprot:3336034-Rhodomonas_salina.1